MKHRFLTGLAVAPLTLAMLTAGPADAVSGGARAQAQLPLVAPLGKVAGSWRTFANRRGAAVWWSSRAFGSIPSNHPVTLADVVAAEGPNAHVVNVYLNVSAALDAYPDNVAVDGVRYDFAATPKPVTVEYDMPCEQGGGGTVTITAANNTASTQKIEVSGAGLRPRRVGGGSKSATLHGCPAEDTDTAPEQSGDLTPGVPGKAGGGFAAEGQPVLAAAVSEPAKQAADSVGLLAGSMVAAASAAFAGTAMVRRRKVRR